jgi:hypothetical protein
MLTVSRAGLVTLCLLSAACSFQVGTSNGGGNAPRTAHHHPPPPPPRRLGSAPAPPPPTPAAPAPAPAPASPAVQNAVAPAPAQPATNTQKIVSITQKRPKQCGYVEVSPNNWVHIDCKRYNVSAKAVPHLSPRKARVVYAHKQLFRPVHRLGVHHTTPSGTGGGVVSPTDNGGGQRSEAFPSTVDHRALGLESPVKNQGQVGSCTAHSLSSALDNAAIRAGRLKAGDFNAMASPLHVWSRYGLPDMGAAADGNISQPVGAYNVWPQNDKEACKIMQNNGDYAADCGEALEVQPGTWRSDGNIMAKYNKSQTEGQYKLASIERIEKTGSTWNKEEILGALASGADLWIAMSVDVSAWATRNMHNAVISDWTKDSGGHAIVMSGYRDTPSGRQYMIHNSWGDSWGDHGYAWINEAMLDKWMDHAYRVKITNGVPKEELTDDDCAPDELVDLGTGLCAVMCNNDGRPNNGCH